MSHIVKIRTEFRSLKAIKRAAKKLGLKFNQGQTRFRYYGSSHHSADHVMEIPGFSYGIGLKKVGSGAKVSYDLEFDPIHRELTTTIGRNAEVFKKEYAVAAATIEAEDEGLTVTRYDNADGSIRLEAAYA